MLKKFLIVGVLCLVCASCENDESDKLAQAQNCLDNVPSSNPTAANSCMSYVSGLDSEQANIIKCSIKFLAGGLTTDKISDAYKQLNDDSVTDKEAFYISMLALSPASLASEAADYCERSGVKGLIYLANLSVVGSVLMEEIGVTGIPDATDVQNALTACQSAPGTCDDTAIGTAVLVVADSYCAGSSADAGICSQINEAVLAAGTDPAAIAQQIYALLDN